MPSSRPNGRRWRAASKLVHLTFKIDPGPKVEVAEVVFDGNQAFTDGKLRRQMKNNKPSGFLGLPRRCHLQGSQVRRGCRPGERVLQEQRLRRRAGRAAADRRDSHGPRRQDAGGFGCACRSTRASGSPIGKFEITGEDPKLNLEAIKGLFKIQGRRCLQQREDPEGARQGQGGLRRLRVLAVVVRPGAAAARHRSGHRAADGRRAAAARHGHHHQDGTRASSSS